MLITGAGAHRYHGDSRRAARRRAACCRYGPESVPAGASAELGPTLAVNPTETTIRAVQKKLGMADGFDVGLEMSGNPQALREMIANMSGGKIAILGIPTEEMPMDWRQVIFNMLTIKGIY